MGRKKKKRSWLSYLEVLISWKLSWKIIMLPEIIHSKFSKITANQVINDFNCEQFYIFLLNVLVKGMVRYGQWINAT